MLASANNLTAQKWFNRFKQRGFNLVEIAIALVILALALGGVISAFAPQLTTRGFTTTQSQLVEINESILAFAAANGRLPCPATSISQGRESFCSTAVGPPAQCAVAATPPDGAAAMTTSRGRCSAAPNAGFVPAVTLGLAGQGGVGTVVDAWAGTIQYVVTAVFNTTANASPTLTPTFIASSCAAGASTCSPFTQNFGIKNAYYNQPTPPAFGPTLASPPSNTFVCASATSIVLGTCGTAVNLRAQPAYVVFSQGRVRVRTPPSADETANTNLDRAFVSRDRTDDAAAVPFDDLLVWTTVDQLRARMERSRIVP